MSEAVQNATPTSVAELKRKMRLRGTVTRLELYGAFIDIGLENDAMIHISQLGKDKVNRVADVLNVGDAVTIWIDKVDSQQGQVMVTMVEPLAVEWGDLQPGQSFTGRVTRLEKYGAFVDIGAEREGLVHISELSHDYVKHPSEAVNVGDEVQVQVLKFSKRQRRIDLSIKALLARPEEEVIAAAADNYVDDIEEEVDEDMPTAMEFALRKAMGDERISRIDSRRRRGGKRRKKRERRRDRLRDEQNRLLNRTLELQDDE